MRDTCDRETLSLMRVPAPAETARLEASSATL
jgi:hypothetical protein